jgi:SAM-dependent methyltransferase
VRSDASTPPAALGADRRADPDRDAAVAALRESLRRKIAEEAALYFGALRPDWLDTAQQYFWDESLQRGRIANLVRHGVRPGVDRVLDLASGCGQFLIHSLDAGYDCIGLEPDPWRREFVAQKIDLLGRPPAWKTRIRAGRAEALPFDDDYFDYVTSYQTLEHVQDPAAAIREMLRVTRVGGAVHIMCPDYRGTFEGHYRLPWLPLMPRPIARSYLRALGRPTLGLDTIGYVTRPRILRWIRDAERSRRFQVSDENRVAFQNALRRRGLPDVPGAHLLWRLIGLARGLGRSEFDSSLLIRVWEKSRAAHRSVSAGGEVVNELVAAKRRNPFGPAR